MIRPPPRSTRTDPLFPYTTLSQAGHAEHVLERPVDQEFTQTVTQPVHHWHRLAFENLAADAMGHADEIVEHAALDPAGILHADHHRGQQVLEKPRRGEEIGRADLEQVLQNGDRKSKRLNS